MAGAMPTFPDQCKYMGMFEEVNDPDRGRVLIQTKKSQAPGGFEGDSYQRPYPTTGFAQVRLVIEAMRSGICISLFHALWQASRMAS
jgi:hypothetical protein